MKPDARAEYTNNTHREPMKLQCDDCRNPVAVIVGDHLVIRSRHHGHKHKTVIAISDIVRWSDMEAELIAV